MKRRHSVGWCFCLLLLFIFCLLTTMPFIQLLAQSFSGEAAVQSGYVKLWPVDFQLDAYEILLSDRYFYYGLLVSIARATLGSIFSVFMIVLLAYPLSKKNVPGASIFTIIAMLTMYFHTGLIPSFLVVKKTGLMNNFLVYIIPTAVSAYNMMLMKNFMQSLPGELEDAARIDGCNSFQVLFKIVLPLSKAMLATLLLFVAVNQWNAFMDAILYISNRKLYPIQVYLRETLDRVESTIQTDAVDLPKSASESVLAATTFLSALPIMLVYPFLQKYFAKGVTIGAVKG